MTSKSQKFITRNNYLGVTLHISFSLAVTLVHIFNQGPSKNNRPYIFWDMQLGGQREKKSMRNGRTSQRILIFCSKKKKVMCQFHLYWPKQIKWPAVGWERLEVVGVVGGTHLTNSW